MKPLAERVDSFNPRLNVLYRCFKCNSSFAILGDKVHFCYNCGEPVEWDGVLTRLKNTFQAIWVKEVGTKMDIDEFERIYIDELNKKQLGEAYTQLYNEDGSPKKCDNCVHAVGTEDCEIPESERETILIPRRLHYCHGAICNKYSESTDKET